MAIEVCVCVHVHACEVMRVHVNCYVRVHMHVCAQMHGVYDYESMYVHENILRMAVGSVCVCVCVHV